MKLTEWFPAHIKPVNVGWYESKGYRYHWFWDGAAWCGFLTNGETFICHHQDRIWRGIAGCKKCGGEMKPGKAIAQTYSGTPDFAGDTHAVTMSPGGKGKLIDCQKCSNCGWSTT